MIARTIAVAAAAVVAGIAVWWATRPPRLDRDHVSQAWRDAQMRERRD